MPSSVLRKSLEKAAARYHGQLLESAPPDGVIGYFRDHAIADSGIISAYQLGYVTKPLRGDERFMGAIAIPYLTPKGVVFMKYRNLGGGMKYNGSRMPTRLYNAAAYFRAGSTIGITEGEVDAIVATERLGIPSLGVAGSEGWKDAYTHLFRDFTQVIVFADGDESGRMFAEKVMDRIGWRARKVQCPEGEDVASMISSGRGDVLVKLAAYDEEDDEDGQ